MALTDYQAKLASTIQGEAAGPSGQFAVAATMQNRLSQGIDTHSSLLSVGSFEANNHYTPPSAFAQQMAVAVDQGNVGNYGSTGNATYYNAAGTNAAYDAGGHTIAGNSYSDVYNKSPSQDFQPPQYGGTGDPVPNANTGGAATFTQGGAYPGADQNGPGVASYAGADGSHYTNAFGTDGPNYAYQQTQNADGSITTQPVKTATGDIGNTPDTFNADGSRNVTLGEQTVSTQQQAPTTPQDGTYQLSPGTYQDGGSAPMTNPTPQQQQQTPSAPTADGNNAGAGMPIVVTDITSAGSAAGTAISGGVSQAGSTVSQGVQTGASTVGTAIGTFGQTLTSLVNSALSGSTDIFVRVALVLLALVLLAGAFAFFTVEKGSNGDLKIVPVPV